MQAASVSTRTARLAGQTVVAEAGTSARCIFRAPFDSCRRAGRGRVVKTRALDAGASGIVQGASQVAWLAAVGMGLAWLATEAVGQGRAEGDEEACSSCGGSGVVDCMCTRWSDNDIGCGSCQGSGKATCHHCGGGGTRIPVTAKVYAERSTGPLQ